MPIESAFQIALTERAAELAIWATKPPLSADSSEAWAEQAFASIYADYVSTQLRLSDLIEDTSIRANLAAVDSASEKANANRTLPVSRSVDFFQRHVAEATESENVENLEQVCGRYTDR